MHSMKTGALLKASILRVRLPGKTPSQHDLSQLEVYGNAIGLAFKSSMTFWMSSAIRLSFGKTAGKDALEDKPTYVSLLGLEKPKNLLKNNI